MVSGGTIHGPGSECKGNPRDTCLSHFPNKRPLCAIQARGVLPGNPREKVAPHNIRKIRHRQIQGFHSQAVTSLNEASLSACAVSCPRPPLSSPHFQVGTLLGLLDRSRAKATIPLPDPLGILGDLDSDFRSFGPRLRDRLSGLFSRIPAPHLGCFCVSSGLPQARRNPLSTVRLLYYKYP
jgi:hypothetical protein